MEDAIAGIFGGAGGSVLSVAYAFWQCKQNAKDIEDLRKEHEDDVKIKDAMLSAVTSAFADFRLHIAEEYAKKGDVERLGDRLSEQLNRIENKLDSKADKP